MKNIKILGCFLFVLNALVSCSSSKPIALQNENQETKIITQTVHDTIFKVEKDSSSLAALIECQNGKAVIKNISQSEPGRNLKSPKVRIENNILKVDCEARANELLAKYKSTHVESRNKKTITNTIEVNKLTFFQELQIKGFRLLIVILLLLILFNNIKSKL